MTDRRAGIADAGVRIRACRGTRALNRLSIDHDLGLSERPAPYSARTRHDLIALSASRLAPQPATSWQRTIRHAPDQNAGITAYRTGLLRPGCGFSASSSSREFIRHRPHVRFRELTALRRTRHFGGRGHRCELPPVGGVRRRWAACSNVGEDAGGHPPVVARWIERPGQSQTPYSDI